MLINTKKYDHYKYDYIQFAKLGHKPKYISLSSKTAYDSYIANLLKYESLSEKDDVFLIVPSIFNSPEILFLSGHKNFINNLRAQGKVYLINWQETKVQLTIEDLVQELGAIIDFIKKTITKKIHLIGHCIGGNICIALAQNFHIGIKSLTLMNTPWDFSHFSNLKNIIESPEFKKIIKDRDLIPKIYVQIMFFLMYPAQYRKKINKYFTSSEPTKHLFMQVEDWLQSGISIPKSLYIQIIDEFCLQNVTYNEKWIMDKSKVTLEKINIPTCIIYAKADQIVPYTSIVPLLKQIKTSTLIKVEGGHIGYLIKHQSHLEEKYNNWLENILAK